MNAHLILRVTLGAGVSYNAARYANSDHAPGACVLADNQKNLTDVLYLESGR